MAARRKTDRAPDLFDLDLLAAAVRIARPANGVSSPRWDSVARIFGVGSEQAIELCDRFNADPYEIINPL